MYASPKKIASKIPLKDPLTSTIEVKVKPKSEPKKKVENSLVFSEVEDDSTKDVRVILDTKLSQN